MIVIIVLKKVQFFDEWFCKAFKKFDVVQYASIAKALSSLLYHKLQGMKSYDERSLTMKFAPIELTGRSWPE